MDYSRLSAALLTHVRGRMSQERVSRHLGYASNVVHLWERRKRLPPASILFELARLRRRVDVAGLWAFAGERAPARSSAAAQPLPTVATMVRTLAGDQPRSELARTTGFDRGTLGRWMAGATEPRLPDFLQFVDRCALRLLEFVSLFADPEALEPTRAAQIQFRKQMQLAYRRPWSSPVLLALSLSAYLRLQRHRSQVIAEHIGISPLEVDAELSALAEAGLVRMEDGLWRPVAVSSVDTRTNFLLNRSLKAHWAQVGADRAHHLQPGASSLFSYNVFSIASADLEQLRELHVDYYQRVRQLVAAAEGADHVVVVNVQLCVLDEPAAARR